MTTNTETGVRRAAVHDLAPGAVARGQNFYVQWLEGETREFDATSAHEMLVLLPEDGAEIAVGDGRRSACRAAASACCRRAVRA
ncbi:hypothetical protein [Burkholderia gladioli]|uniref:hypothetical protein n=1 Tax=Burkholderia gladioli TaxID=28095 RepID=UPI002181ECC8|nr:hypothetical protein [Burkholderia gladioli]